MNKLFDHVTKYLHAHASGFGAALTLLLADLNSGDVLTRSDWVAIAGAYLGVGAAISVLPHGGKGAPAGLHAAVGAVEEFAGVHDDGTEDVAS